MENEPFTHSRWTLLSRSSIDNCSEHGKRLGAASTAPAGPGPSVSLKEIHKFSIVHLAIDEIYDNATSILDSL